MASIYYYNYFCIIDDNIKKYLDNFIINTLSEINKYKFKDLKIFFFCNFEEEITEKMKDILSKEIKTNEILFDEELFSNVEKYLTSHSVINKLKIANLINYIVSEALENKPNNFFEFYEYIKDDIGLNSLGIV